MMYNYLSNSECKFSWKQSTVEKHLAHVGKMAMKNTLESSFVSLTEQHFVMFFKFMPPHMPLKNKLRFLMKPSRFKCKLSIHQDTKKCERIIVTL